MKIKETPKVAEIDATDLSTGLLYSLDKKFARFIDEFTDNHIYDPYYLLEESEFELGDEECKELRELQILCFDNGCDYFRVTRD